MVLDVVLGLLWLAPEDVVQQAVDRNSGEEFARIYNDLAARAAGYRRTHSGWEPAKLRTPLDPMNPPLPSQKLQRWRERQTAAFAAWAADHADAGPWDFSAHSLDALATVLLAELTFGDVEDVDSGHPLVQLAAWYMGETLLHHADGGWYLLPGTPTRGVDIVGRPIVCRAEDSADCFVPVRIIATLIKTGVRRVLRAGLEAFTGG